MFLVCPNRILLRLIKRSNLMIVYILSVMSWATGIKVTPTTNVCTKANDKAWCQLTNIRSVTQNRNFNIYISFIFLINWYFYLFFSKSHIFANFKLSMIFIKIKININVIFLWVMKFQPFCGKISLKVIFYRNLYAFQK